MTKLRVPVASLLANAKGDRDAWWSTPPRRVSEVTTRLASSGNPTRKQGIDSLTAGYTSLTRRVTNNWNSPRTWTANQYYRSAKLSTFTHSAITIKGSFVAGVLAHASGYGCGAGYIYPPASFALPSLSEPNPGRLGPKERSQHLLTQAARDRETTESLGQNRVVRGTIVGTDRVARNFTGDTLHTQPPSQTL